ncbi:MAG: hypothetical protein IPM42_15540 [Saprospiraceae bacterium]|nr:hypothetical protein [Saprospiraceae bacterium]
MSTIIISKKNIRYFHILILSFFLNTASKSILGQSSLLFDHYGPEKGFRSSQALTIHKASDGYLWIGTEQGLVQYDGHTFRTFRSDSFDPLTLTDNYIKRITEDRHGRLWVAALPCVNIFDTRDFKVKRIHYSTESQPDSLLIIHSFYYEKDVDLMWISTQKGLLYSQGMDIHLEREFIPGLDEEIFSIDIDRNRELWLTGKNGIYHYDPEDCKIKKYDKQNAVKVHNTENDFFCGHMDDDGMFWAGSWTSGLVRLDTSSGEMKFFYYADPNKIQNGIITIQKSYNPQESHTLWLGTTEGLQTFDKQSFTFKSYKTENTEDKYGVPGACLSLYSVDNESVWIGTLKGLHQCDGSKQFVSHSIIHLPEEQKNRFVGDIVFEKKQERDSILWLSFPYHSFYRYDLVNQILTEIPGALKQYCTVDSGPFALYSDSQLNLWMSSQKNGVIIYNLNDGQITIPQFTELKQEKIKVLEFLEHKPGEIIFNTAGGLYLYKEEQNLVEEIKQINDFLLKNEYSLFSRSITTDKNGKLWLLINRKESRYSDICMYDTETHTIILFKQDKISALEAATNLEKIQWIGNNRIVITAFNGFCLVEDIFEQPDFIHFSEFNNHAIGICRNSSTDGLGRVWISTETGVVILDPIEKTTAQFTHYNSGLKAQPHPLIYFSESENRMYLAKDLSVDFIDLDKLHFPSLGKTFLSNMKVNGKEIVPLPDLKKPLQLDYSQNSLRFEFTNLNFTNPEDNTYRYRLRSGDIWSEMNGNTINFEELGYGSYNLEVSSTNGFREESAENYSLKIIIHPPFWRTSWFQLLILILIITIIYAIFRYREIQLEKLEKWRQAVARDLHDDMGSTLSYIRMLSEMEAIREKANPSFQRISEKTGEVMANMSEIIWSINPANDNLKQILLKIQACAIEMLEPSGILLVFDLPDIPDDIRFSQEDRRHFFMIFKEAINNTAKYARATACHLNLKLANNTVTIQFSDNGTGFNPQFISMGNGLKNMKSRAEALKAQLEINTGEDGTTISLVVRV